MTHDARDPRTVQVPDDVRGYVAALIGELGPRRAAARLGVCRSAAMGVALAAPVMPGTLALIREAMRQRAA